VCKKCRIASIINKHTHKLTVCASGPFLVAADWYLAILSFREVVSTTLSGDNTTRKHTHRDEHNDVSFS
jgi:hypothetical protein